MPLDLLCRQTEAEWGDRAARFLKSELKKADLTYEDLVSGSRSMD